MRKGASAMPAAQRPPGCDRESSGTGTGTVGIGVVLLMIACCALPGLIAAGALAGLGGFVGNPWVITAAVLLAAAVIATVVRRRGSGRDGCCPPTETSKKAPTGT